MNHIDDSGLPQQIGPYRILGLLGEGSNGRVYKAQQSDPQREVALKVLRSAGLSGEAQQRFRREAELLAQLEHPGIARLYAAGVADGDAGPLPYLAMELVRGVDLLRYAQQHRLDLRAKLALLAQVCQAVHYAHSRGIVHRDLKPANILVGEDGHPRILDFGVASVAEDAASMTVAGEVLGTVPYMSPEQLAGGARGSDPRSDVYSLGVIAYELLSGELPYPGLSKSTVIEAITLIREGRIEPLSKREPKTRGDAETVVMKAMAQEAPRRYGSAAELASDLERFLRHQPIEAHPPSAMYVMRLFVRRHRAVSAAIAAALAMLVIGALVSLRYGLAEAQARKQADATNAFLEKMLTAADPAQDMGRELRVRELLDEARRQLPNERDPAVVASLDRTLGATYLSLGEAEIALDMLERALELSVATEGEQAQRTRELHLLHARALVQQRRYDDAQRELEALVASPANDEAQWRLRFDARRQLGISIMEQGREDEAEAFMRALHADMAKRFGEEDGPTLVVEADLAAMLQMGGKPKEALALQEKLLAIQTRKIGADAAETLDVQSSLAVTLADLDQSERALAIMREVVERERRIYGPTHPKTIISLQNLAGQTAVAGLAEESYAQRRELLDAALTRYGRAHARSIDALAMMATQSSVLGREDEAADYYRQSIEAAHSDPLLVVNGIIPQHNFANWLLKRGRPAEARAEFETAVADAIKHFGAEDWRTAAFMANYGNCLSKLGEYPLAREQLERSLAVLEKELGPQHDRTRDTREKLRGLYQAMGLKAEAEALPESVAP